MVCALTCCTSLVVSSHESLKRNSHSSKRIISHGCGAHSVCEMNELNRLEGTSFPTPLEDDGRRSPERCNSSLRRRWTFLPGKTVNCKLNWSRADSKQQTSLQQPGKKYELHSAVHRRRESAWKHGCWESQATSRVLKMRGNTGVQCSGDTLAQRYHDCRS